MKVPTANTIAVLLAAALAAGCTVNIHNPPAADPGPAEVEPEAEQPEQPTPPRRRAEPRDEPATQEIDATITRREERPKTDPDSVKVEDPTDRRGNPRRERREEPKHPEAKPDSDDPPNRPGLGKGRDESQEAYPGKGEARGLDKQQERDRVHPDSAVAPGQGKREEPKVQPGEGNSGRRLAESDSDRTRPDSPTPKQPEHGRDREANGRNTQPVPDVVRPDPKRPDPEPKAADPQAKPDANPETGERGRRGRAEPKADPREPAPESPEEQPEATPIHLSPATTLGIEAKHLPAPGKCRVWIVGRAAGEQAKAGNCERVEATAPAGAWVLYRPRKDNKVVHLQVIDLQRDGVVTHVWIYDASSGKYLRSGG